MENLNATMSNNVTRPPFNSKKTIDGGDGKEEDKVMISEMYIHNSQFHFVSTSRIYEKKCGVLCFPQFN